jgi:flagellar biosynthesis GTPase FlhF
VASSIGIKIANGEFYSIIEENSQVKKRLVLTTVHNNQQSVQIDLYRSSTATMADALYVGSLVLEDIKKRPKGEPSIELVIASDSNGNITADAVDLDASGERQTLNVSLKSMEEENLGADIPDFEFDNYDEVPKGLYEKPEESGKEKGKKGFPWLLVILAALVLTAIALLVWLFFFQGTNPISVLTKLAAPVSQSRTADTSAAPAQTAPAAPAAQPVAQPASQPAAQPAAQPTQTTPQSEPQITQSAAAPVQSAPQNAAQSAAQTTQAAAPPVIQSPAVAASQRTEGSAPANRQRAAAPVASYNVPSVIPREGVSYRVRYGDTLWDIADAFYRNPWLYPRIALFNNIRNPDLIISGTTIIVPPRN